jgi:hypothetical protein
LFWCLTVHVLEESCRCLCAFSCAAGIPLGFISRCGVSPKSQAWLVALEDSVNTVVGLLPRM